MAFVSHTAKQWLAGHKKGISILRSIPPLVTPLFICLCLSSSFSATPFFLYSLFFSPLSPAWPEFLCVMGLEALGPFVSAFHLNVAQIMLWVGLDAAPPWQSANGVCEDTALSLLRFHLLSFFFHLSPSPLHWLTHKDPLLLFFSPREASSWGLVKQRTNQNTPQLQLSSTNGTVFLFYFLFLFLFFGKMCHNRPLYWLE